MKRILVAGEKIISTPEHKIVLEAKGYQLLLMKDLHSALSLILEDPPDMLIMEKAFGEEKSPSCPVERGKRLSAEKQYSRHSHC
jgi:hypothetical protein